MALTGAEIAFGGDMTRSLKQDNYLVLETEAQGFPCWTPYPGQLRLQAYSHLASGANSVMYWHWHSIHNSVETYWKGLLSHDFAENDTYREACVIGKEFAEKGDHLVNLKKKNDVAILASNEALTALKYFPMESPVNRQGAMYNDVLRWMADALFDMNVECDIIWPETEDLSGYRMILIPALYAVPDETLERLNRFVENGGHLVSTMRSFVSDDEVSVWADRAPHNLTDVFGMTYNQFTRPNGHVSVEFAGALEGVPSTQALSLIELVAPADGTEVLATYGHYAWKDYAAVTRNTFGKGSAEWIATLLDAESIRAVMREAVEYAGVAGAALRSQVGLRFARARTLKARR